MQLTHNPTYANLPSRAVAGLIDWQIKNVILLYSLTLLVDAATLNQLVPLFFTTLAYIWLPLALFYPFFILTLLSATGYSPGKGILGIRIADRGQQPLTFKRALFRELIAKRVSAALLMLGYFHIAVDPNHQGWHDQFSDSYAYNLDSRPIFGVVMMLLVALLQVYLGYSVVTHLLANHALIGDVTFLLEPLLQLLK